MFLVILGIALLTIVHEAGHYFVARAFGMRVERFSIGFGPAIFKFQPKNSDTVFQIGLIPLLAYVQIAGMNPFDELDEDDPSLYANAKLGPRISAIIAGPLANYLFASVFFFAVFLMVGKPGDGNEIRVFEGAAQTAGMQTGDELIAIEGSPIATFTDIIPFVQPRADQPTRMTVRRDGTEVQLVVTPQLIDGKGKIGVSPQPVPIALSEAATNAMIEPAIYVKLVLVGLSRVVTQKDDLQLSGPIGMAREGNKALQMGLPSFLHFLGFLSTMLAVFNLLPFPALDGGRLSFLLYEAITRRKPDQKIEGWIHVIGIVVLLGTMVTVTIREASTDKAPSDIYLEEQEKKQEAEALKKAKPATAIEQPVSTGSTTP